MNLPAHYPDPRHITILAASGKCEGPWRAILFYPGRAGSSCLGQIGEGTVLLLFSSSASESYQKRRPEGRRSEYQN